MSNTNKHKILVVSEVFYPEEFLVNDLVFELVKLGMDVEVLTRTPSYPFGKTITGYKNKIYQTTIESDVKVHRVAIIPGYAGNVLIKILNYIWFIFSACLFTFFKARNYHKIFIYQTGPLTVATAGVIAKKVWKTPYNVYTQDIWPDTVYAYGVKPNIILAKILNLFVTWVYKNADKIIVSCEGFSDKIKHYVPHKDVLYVPNWTLVNNESSSSVKTEFETGVNFTFAGNIGKVQNLENVIEGFSRFNKNQGKANLNIVGDGSNLDSLKQLVANKSIQNVVFWGRKPLSEMPSYFSASDVLIISLIEKPIFELTIPSKFQAYLSAQKPVFCIMNGEVASLVKKYCLGKIANPSNIDDIADGFEYFMNADAEYLYSIAQNASQLLATEFDRNTCIYKISQTLV